MQNSLDILTDDAWVNDNAYNVVQCWSGYTESHPGLRQRARSKETIGPDRPGGRSTYKGLQAGTDSEAQRMGKTLGMKKGDENVSDLSENKGVNGGVKREEKTRRGAQSVHEYE